MSEVILRVRDIKTATREALEQAIGVRLEEHQKVAIHVINEESQPSLHEPIPSKQPQESCLPPWCNVYKGLSDTEIADLEASIVRTSESRSLK
jgi:hypothetical protein